MDKNTTNSSENLNQKKDSHKIQYVQIYSSKVICRVFSRRHGITKVEEQYWTDEKQLPNILMGINGKQEMERLADEMLASGCKAEDTVIVYSPKDEEGNKVRRIIQSKNILQSKLQCAAIETNLLNTWVKIQDEEGKIDNKDDRIVGKLKHAADVAELARHEILGAFNGKWWEYDKYKNIILLSHKSNEPWLDVISTPEAKTVTLSKHKENWNHDDDIMRDENGKAEYKNYKDEKDILKITNENKEEMMKYFQNEKWLYDEICRCEEGGCNIFELQNVVNRYFNEHPELYERYLTSEDSKLMLFCLTNLIQKGKGKFIENNFAKVIGIIDDYNFNETTKTIWDIVVKSGENLLLYIDLFLRTLYVDEKIDDHLSSYIKTQVKDNKEILAQIEYYENLMKHHEKHIQPNISEIRNKSLDERFYTKKDNKEIDNNFDLWDKDIEENCLKLLDNNQTVVIEWDWWSGKSFFSVYFQEQLRKKYFMHNHKSYFPVFIQLSGKDWTKVIWEIEEQQSYYTNYDFTLSPWHIKWRKDDGKQIVYFFESLDESEFCNEGGIKTLLDYIQQNDLKSVINTRAWYLDDRKIWNIKKYTTKWMKDPMKYVEDFFGGNEKNIEKYKQLQKQIWEEYMQKNSLFVTILCELIQEWGENLEKIDSKWNLFGVIVEHRLSKWEGRKDWRKPTVNTKNENSENQFDKEIQDRLRVLEEIAYCKSNNWGKIEEKDINYITDLDHESLSFLFKKNEHGEYWFIHQSFEDYLLLRYFTRRPEKLEKVIKKSQERKENNNMKILLIATKEWYKEIIELLVNNWYNYNEKNKYWTNVFMYACLRWDIEIVELLIDKIDDIDETDDENQVLRWTIMSACEGWNLEILKLLYNRNKIKKMWPSLICACRSNQIEMLEWLFDKFKDSIKKEEIKYIFLNTCFEWHLEIVKRLYDKCWYDKYENRNEKRFELEKAFKLANKYDIIERLYYKISDLELDHMLYIERISWVTYWTSQSSIEENVDMLNISLEELNKRLSMVQKQWYKEITKLLQAKINKLKNKT